MYISLFIGCHINVRSRYVQREKKFFLWVKAFFFRCAHSFQFRSSVPHEHHHIDYLVLFFRVYARLVAIKLFAFTMRGTSYNTT